MTLSPYTSGPVSHWDCEHASSDPFKPSETNALRVSMPTLVCASTVTHLKNSCLPRLTVCPIGTASQAPPEIQWSTMATLVLPPFCLNTCLKSQFLE